MAPAPTPQIRALALAQLRQLEWRPPLPAQATGLAALDARLPGGGLQSGAVHEILATEHDKAAAYGFMVMLIAEALAQGTVLWCQGSAALYGPALAELGLSPERLVLVRAYKSADQLWAMEEGLRTAGIAAVVGEVERLDLTASRRLQLAAQASGVACFVLRPLRHQSNAAATRWQVETAPAHIHGATSLADSGPMRGRWRVRLLRCRGAIPSDDTGYGGWLVTARAGERAPQVAPSTLWSGEGWAKEATCRTMTG